MGLVVGLRASARVIGALWLLLIALLLSVAAPASAQSVPPAPNPSSIDGHGVDLISGRLVTGATDVAIGPADHGGLSFGRQWVKNGWRVANLPTISGDTAYPVVSFGGQSVPFEPNGSGGYKTMFEDGSTLSNDRTSFTSGDGTQITFTATSYSYYTIDSNLGLGTLVAFPDGTRWTYHYQTDSAYLGPAMPPQCSDPYYLSDPGWQAYCGSLASQWQTYNVRRLSSITSSTGYQIKLHYATNTLTYGGVDNWFYVTQATALNNAVEYCNPTASTCSFANTWPQVGYNNWVDGQIASVTDPMSRTTNYSYSISGSYQNQLTGIRAPGDSSNTITYDYTSDKVSSVTVGGQPWLYEYGTNATTVKNPLWISTDPTANARTVNYTSAGLVTSTVAGGQTTTFTYCTSSDTNCPEDLLKEVTLPESNKVQYAYDARGNRTSETRIDKSGSSNTIVTSATYASTCTNQKTCNKPLTTTDARGQVTDYVYDAGHGGVTSIKAPADVNGIRPETRITYTNYQAYFKNSSGSIVASGVNLALPVNVSACRTTASCDGGTDEREANIGYGPQTAGVANNLNPVAATTALGNGTLAATTTLAYDNYGRTVSVDGPQSGTADRTLYGYNLANQLLWQIGPDPDGAGAALFPAVRPIYRTDGQVDYVQTGTVTVQDGTFGTWNRTNVKDFVYDSYHRRIREAVQDGPATTTFQVTDYVYDSAGRALCAMQRMDPAQWGYAVATSCTPTQTTGPNGPDRVTYNHYDALGRVSKVTTGYGITGLAADEAIKTFSANGQLLTLTDAEGNRTTYEYDGHDRLATTYFPHPSLDNTSATCGVGQPCDYEQLTYDANGNVTTFRTRSGYALTLSYDNLNRLRLKHVPDRPDLAATHEREVHYGYDLFGDLLYARFDGAADTYEGVTNAFDALGQLTSTATKMDSVTRTLSYGYDVAGIRRQITHPDGTYFYYHPTPAGGFYYATISNYLPLFYAPLDTAGRVSALARYKTSTGGWWDGSATGFAYDGVSRLAWYKHDLAGTGNDTQTDFTYNPASQIATSARDNDLYAWMGSSNVNKSYTTNGLNQYTANPYTVGSPPAGSFADICYDAGGNLIGDGLYVYIYDVENRLVERRQRNQASCTGLPLTGTLKASLRYDPLGRLYEATDNVPVTPVTRRFLYDGDALVAEYNTSGTMLRRYVHGPGAGDDPLVWFEGSGVADSARRYLYADERGSIVAVTDSTGAVLARNTYDEYGIPASTNLGAFQYTGQVWLPELGMYTYKARMYSPTLGRFMQTDPIGYGDGMNMYGYVHGDPVNGVDPSGLMDVFCDSSGHCVDENGNTVSQDTKLGPGDTVSKEGATSFWWSDGQGGGALVHASPGASILSGSVSSVGNTGGSESGSSGAPGGQLSFTTKGDTIKNWTIAWQVSGKVSGQIVQQVTDTLLKRDGTSFTVRFSEAWGVSNGHVRNGTDTFEVQDTYRGAQLTVHSDAYFYEGLTLPNSFKPGNDGGAWPSGGLSSTWGFPNLGDPTSGPVTRNWTSPCYHDEVC